MMRRLIPILLLLIAAIAPLHAGDDLADAQTVITTQAEAFARDDGTAAYAQAAPLVQQIFPQVDAFMEMVRSGYAPIYRHKSFEFVRGGASEGKITQLVSIVDDKGVSWEALYTLERQADGLLKITGCTLLKASDTV